MGCPVQFLDREELRERGAVTKMEGYGTYNMPPGTWTDDSSMALATLASINEQNRIDLRDIMERFLDWEFHGAYTPFGEAFDEGNTCSNAIYKYRDSHDLATCGETGEYSNGNGALMRILPVCLYFIQKEDISDAVSYRKRIVLFYRKSHRHNGTKKCRFENLYPIRLRKRLCILSHARKPCGADVLPEITRLK